MSARCALLGLAAVVLLTGCFDAVKPPRCGADAVCANGEQCVEGRCLASDPEDLGAGDTRGERDAPPGDAPEEAGDEDAADMPQGPCDHDGRCGAGETHEACPDECRPCGDGVCELGEQNCDSDCGAARWPQTGVVFFNSLPHGAYFKVDGKFAVELPPRTASVAFSPPVGLMVTLDAFASTDDRPLASTLHRFGDLQFVALSAEQGDSIVLRADALPPPVVDAPGFLRVVQLDPGGSVQVHVDGVRVGGVGLPGSVGDWIQTCAKATVVLEGQGPSRRVQIPTGNAASFAFVHADADGNSVLQSVVGMGLSRADRCGDGCCTGTEDDLSCRGDCACLDDGLCEQNEAETCPDCATGPPVDGPGFAVVNTLGRGVEVWTSVNGGEFQFLVQLRERSASGLFQVAAGDDLDFNFSEVGNAGQIAQAGTATITFKTAVVLTRVEAQDVVIRFDPATTDALEFSPNQFGLALGNFAPALSGNGGIVAEVGRGDPIRLGPWSTTGKFAVYGGAGDIVLTVSEDLDDAPSTRLGLRTEQHWYYFGVVVDGPDETPELLLAPLGTWNVD